MISVFIGAEKYIPVDHAPMGIYMIADRRW